MDQHIQSAERDYIDQGWCEINLPDQSHVSEIARTLTEKLVSLTNEEAITLSTYHQFVFDEEHDEIHWNLANFLWSQDIGVEIGRHQYFFLRSFVGPDLLVQAKPFLRIARPGIERDNIGYHRDTTYGQSPFEVTMFMPLVDLPVEAGMCVIPKTHVIAEGDIKTESLADSEWSKGSPKHDLGFPYAPRKLVWNLGESLRAVPLKRGQAMLFSPSLVHGQAKNESPVTRFSIDIRFLNAHAPIDINRDIEGRGYKPVVIS